jgi:hypothetical protein
MVGTSKKAVYVDQLALPAFRRLLSHEQREVIVRARRIDAGAERPLADFGRGTYAFLLAVGTLVYMKALPDFIIIEHLIVRR